VRLDVVEEIIACDGPLITEGAWSLSYGNGSADFQVPWSGSSICVEGN